MQLVLVRHGQSTWNLEHRLQGQTLGVPLTELGRTQAREAAERVAALVPAGTPVLTSDQLRAVQTAEPIAAALGVTPRRTEALREQALGELEGRLTSELAAEPVPEGLHISEVCWGGGESIEQVHLRCRLLLARLADEYPDAPAMVLVGHGDSLRVLLAVLDGRGHRDVEWGVVGNGKVIARSWNPAV